MKKLYSVCFSMMLAALVFALVSTTATAQKYTFTPGTTVQGVWNGDGYMDLNIYIKNMTNSDLALKWRRISSDFPESWDYSLCDNGNCYPGAKTEAEFIPFGAGAEAFMKLSVGPNTDQPVGRLIYGISEVGSSIEDTVTFIVQSMPTSVNEGVAGQIQVSPNPVQDVLSFTLPSSISSVKVMNALGQVMIEKNNVSETLKIDFSALATGTYMVVLLDKNSGAIVRKVQKY